MSPSLAFALGIFIGVAFGFFLAALLSMSRDVDVREARLAKRILRLIELHFEKPLAYHPEQQIIRAIGLLENIKKICIRHSTNG